MTIWEIRKQRVTFATSLHYPFGRKMGDGSFPIKWVPIDEEERQRKLRVFHEADSAEVDMVRSIPSGIRLNKEILNWAEKIYKLALRPDDVFVVTYPKCGTTWMMVCRDGE